jgi:hypothetical protein
MPRSQRTTRTRPYTHETPNRHGGQGAAGTARFAPDGTGPFPPLVRTSHAAFREIPVRRAGNQSVGARRRLVGDAARNDFFKLIYYRRAPRG